MNKKLRNFLIYLVLIFFSADIAFLIPWISDILPWLATRVAEHHPLLTTTRTFCLILALTIGYFVLGCKEE